MTQHEQLSELCQRLGATREQAGTMASQLLKRAEQLAGERAITREAALQHLLELVTKGRAGQVPDNLRPPGTEK
jgi:predicted ArsR family transcriptional regulator